MALIDDGSDGGESRRTVDEDDSDDVDGLTWSLNWLLSLKRF